MRRRLIVLVIVGAATAVVGCGAPTTDAEQIRRTVRQFGADLADGRAKQACAALTPSAVAEVVKVNAASGFATRAEAAAVARALATPSDLRELRALAIADIRIRGDRATGRLRKFS
jgi:hypothetical protein